MGRVFISYSTLDREFVETIILPSLHHHGLETWYSRDDIDAGERWERTIREGLDICDWFIVVVSSNSCKSEWVHREVSWAVRRREGRIIPILIDTSDPADLHLALETIQCIDFTAGSTAALKRLLRVWSDSGIGEKTSPVRKETLFNRDVDQSESVTRDSVRSRRKWRLAMAGVACAAILATGVTLWRLFDDGGHPRGDQPYEQDERELPGEYLRLFRLHRRLAEPSPCQSYQEYLDSEPTTPTGKSWKIYVQPLGEFRLADRKIIERTADFMHVFFDLPVETLGELPLSDVPESSRRELGGKEQFSSRYLLYDVLRPKVPEDAASYFAFTTSDLWPGEGEHDNWSFCFGLATYRERVGVWSIHRYGDPTENPHACLLRTIKIGSSLTCSMFSMPDCDSYKCGMNQTMSVAELDETPLWLCPRCLAKLCWATEMKPAQRFEKLIQFCKEENLDEQREFYEQSLAALHSE